MRGMNRRAGALLDRPWVILGMVAGVAFLLWLAGTRTQEHHIKVAFADAVSVASGQDVTVNGIDVGKVSGVDLVDGQAIVELGISDESVWPLTRGTRAGLRYGTTIGNGTRRVELFPGPDDAPVLPEGGLINERRSSTPTEIDELLQTADAPTRAALRSGQQRIDGSIQGRARQIAADVRATADAMDAVSGLFDELASDDAALREMITHTSSVTRTLAARSSRIEGLLTVAARTFETFAANTQGVQRTLEQVPPTLTEARSTLARLEPSIDRLDRLVEDAAPGVRALRPLAAAARPAFADLRATVPQALSTIRTARIAAPRITSMLRRGAPLVRTAAPVLRDLGDIVHCVSPYAPETAGFLSNWSSFAKNFDQYSSYARVRLVEGDTSFNDVPDLKTSDFTGLTGSTYAGLRPPGLNAGQPWFMPECRITEDVLDPAKDWEDDR